jgi:hypothetical protein
MKSGGTSKSGAKQAQGRAMLKRDRQATEARHFLDKKSYVAPDGREVLYGLDWKMRKQELLKRSLGRCERFSILGKSHDAWCRAEGGEPHHIKKRWPLRDDRLENLANLSHWCHLAEDERKPRWTKRSQS